VKQRSDFILTTPDKHKATVDRLYAEYKGGKPEEGAPAGGTVPGAAAAPEQAKKDSWEQAIEKLEQKDYAGAIPLLKTATEEKPDDVDVYYQLGRAGVETENYAEAEPALKKAKQLDPTKPGVSFQLARLYDKKGRKVQALQALEEEKALSPDSEAVLDNLGRIYSETGQNDKAAEVLESLIASHPDHLDSYATLANVYKATGDKAKEEDVYQRLGARDPKGDALYNLGNLAFNRNEPDKASVYYKQVLEKNPNHPRAHLQLAYTMVNLGDFPGAISHFESFLKLSPKDDKAAEAKAVMDELKKMSGKGSGKS
jgi:Flp pilus assembly protein TadD